MNLDKNIRETLIKVMQLLETIFNEVDLLKCNSVIDFKIKELLQEQIKTAIADVLNTTDTLYEIELALEDQTDFLSLRSVYTAALENYSGYGNGI